MPSLLSGSRLRRGGSGEFIDLAGAMPQLPATDTTLTGFTLVTDSLLRTTYSSALGFIQFTSSSMYSDLPTGSIKILNTGGSTVVSTGTTTGLLILDGDAGIGGTMNIWKDINVNGVTIGTGYDLGLNNIVVRGTAAPQVDNFENGQESIAIGYDTLLGLATSYKSIAIGRYALSTGTNISNNIAIGDSALKLIGTGSTLTNDSNVALGVDAGVSLVVGEQNVFIGHQAANTLGTGSYNIIIGPLTGQYLYTGSGIISIGGDNIVDGKNDQVNIGSVFYYDGDGYAAINAETTVGLGSHAEVLSTGTFTSSSTVTGGLVVVGGIFAYDNLVVGTTVDVLGTGTSTFAGPVVPSTTGATLGTADKPWPAIYVAGSTIYLGTTTLKSPTLLSFNVESTAGFVTQTVGNLYLNSGAVSSNFTTGSLIVTGGAGIAGNVNIDGELNVLGANNVELSPVGADVVIKPSAGGTIDVRPNVQGTIDNAIIGSLDPADAYFENVQVLSTTSATSTVSGALQVVGGVGIQGDIYSLTGNPEENWMLYTPRVTVSTSSPVTARIGDFWIEPTIPAFLQYILDGTSTIWVQIGSV